MVLRHLLTACRTVVLLHYYLVLVLVLSYALFPAFAVALVSGANGALAPGPLTLSKLGGPAMSVFFKLLSFQNLKKVDIFALKMPQK